MPSPTQDKFNCSAKALKQSTPATGGNSPPSAASITTACPGSAAWAIASPNECFSTGRDSSGTESRCASGAATAIAAAAAQAPPSATNPRRENSGTEARLAGVAICCAGRSAAAARRMALTVFSTSSSEGSTSWARLAHRPCSFECIQRFLEVMRVVLSKNVPAACGRAQGAWSQSRP